MTIDEFIPWIQKAKPGRRQNLLDNVKLMRRFDLSPDQLAERGIDGVEALCREYVKERKQDSMTWRAGMANVRKHARATFHALAHLATAFPVQGLPDVAAPDTNWLRGIAEDKQPATLKRELLQWAPCLRVRWERPVKYRLMLG